MKIAVFALAGEDFNCERDNVVLRGNKKEMEWAGRGRGTKTKSRFCV